jgi:hypothetical protein
MASAPGLLAPSPLSNPTRPAHYNDMLQGKARAPSWTSWSGCGALASKSTRPPDDPTLLFSILYGFWAANLVACNGTALRELGAQFLAIAKKQRATGPLMIGHRLMATSLTSTGDLVESLAHYDQAITMYDPAEHRSLATRFGQDVRVAAWYLSVADFVAAWAP